VFLGFIEPESEGVADNLIVTTRSPRTLNRSTSTGARSRNRWPTRNSLHARRAALHADASSYCGPKRELTSKAAMDE
jgi:hypothetical protein